jgi:hypothetical protein
LNAVSTETQFPELSEFLSLSPEKRQDTSEAVRANTILDLLRQKDPQNIASYALFDQKGIDILDTSRLELDRDKFESEYLKKVRDTGKPFASSVEASTNFDTPIIHFCAPVKNEAGEILGTLCARYFISAINLSWMRKGVECISSCFLDRRKSYSPGSARSWPSFVDCPAEASDTWQVNHEESPARYSNFVFVNLPELERHLQSDTYLRQRPAGVTINCRESA